MYTLLRVVCATALEGAGIGPVVLMMRAVEGLHMYAGLPWWGAIMATTLAVRVCVSPLYFSGVSLVVVPPPPRDLHLVLPFACKLCV